MTNARDLTYWEWYEQAARTEGWEAVGMKTWTQREQEYQQSMTDARSIMRSVLIRERREKSLRRRKIIIDAIIALIIFALVVYTIITVVDADKRSCRKDPECRIYGDWGKIPHKDAPTIPEADR